VFNYLLQALETEMNVEKMRRLLEHIRNRNVELPLYTYDSFLFDFPADSSPKMAEDLKAIIEGDGFPIKASWGKTYGNL
jgi:hypothetical protein